jgi:hypothetical protein
VREGAVTIVLILFAIALVVAAGVWAWQLRAQARQLKGGLASFRRRFDDERDNAALTRPPEKRDAP